MCVSIMSELLQVLAKETIVGSNLKHQVIQILNCLTTFPAGGNPNLYLDLSSRRELTALKELGSTKSFLKLFFCLKLNSASL